MTIFYIQPDCQYKPKVVKRGISRTGNYRNHYKKYHPTLPTTTKEEIKIKGHLLKKPFFQTPASEQSHNERYRVLLLDFITINNLSFSLVDKPETKALFSFLLPHTKQIAHTTLVKDLKAKYVLIEEVIHQKLQEHINSEGRISLTTDA